IYVLSRSPHPMQVYDSDGNFITAWDDSIRGHGCSIGADDCFYLATGPDDPENPHIIRKYSLDGKLLMTLGSGQPSDSGFRKIGKAAFESARSITRPGGPFNRTTDVATSPNTGEIYVADGYGNCQVHKFSPEGELLLSWGEPGYEKGQFRIVHGIWIDKNDRVYICDRENDRIQVFDSQGKYITQWLGLSRPGSIFIDAEGSVYIIEFDARVSIFSTDGELLARMGSGWVYLLGLENEEEENRELFVHPHAAVVDKKGDLYISEVGFRPELGGRAIRKFIRKR
ncbi:hypothetical protein ACFLWY_05325, partial [Chloroflexota bacterium]